VWCGVSRSLEGVKRVPLEALPLHISAVLLRCVMIVKGES
jgi:hypothetical protein